MMVNMGIGVLDLSAYVGLVAVGAFTLNLFLGTLLIFRYSAVRQWPHRRFNYFRWHNWCGYLALTAAIVHPVILLFNRDPKFRFLDLVYPVHSPLQPLENSVGAVALYVLAVVVVTSYFRIALGRRIWKAFHFAVYFAAAALLFHSLLTDPDLKTGRVDWLDGGKLFVEMCALVAVALSIFRWRHARKKSPDV